MFTLFTCGYFSCLCKHVFNWLLKQESRAPSVSSGIRVRIFPVFIFIYMYSHVRPFNEFQALKGVLVLVPCKPFYPW